MIKIKTMRQIFFLMLMPLFGFGQIDLTGYDINAGQITHKDTAYWVFSHDTINAVPIYLAEYVHFENNTRTILASSGVLRKKDYVIFLQKQNDLFKKKQEKLKTRWATLRDQRQVLLTEYQGL